MSTRLLFFLGQVFLILYCISNLEAQVVHRSLIEGNEAYENKKFDQAISSYQKALEVDKNEVKAHYNLGNALYQTNKMDEAIQKYNSAVDLSSDAKIKAKAFHNLGNVYVKKNQYKEAVEAYKNSLRLNAEDIETKYNLTQALKILKKQQPPPPQNQQNNNPPPPSENEKPKEDDMDRMMRSLDHQESKARDKRKLPPSNRRRQEKDW
jgi:Ca-activated chloride channel family protein